MGTYLRVLGESFQMNTKMTGFQWFFKESCIFVLCTKVVSALEGLKHFSNISLDLDNMYSKSIKAISYNVSVPFPSTYIRYYQCSYLFNFQYPMMCVPSLFGAHCVFILQHQYLFLAHIKSIVNLPISFNMRVPTLGPTSTFSQHILKVLSIYRYRTICVCLPWGPLLPFLSTYQKYCQRNFQFNFPISYNKCVPIMGPAVSISYTTCISSQ